VSSTGVPNLDPLKSSFYNQNNHPCDLVVHTLYVLTIYSSLTTLAIEEAVFYAHGESDSRSLARILQ